MIEICARVVAIAGLSVLAGSLLVVAFWGLVYLGSGLRMAAQSMIATAVNLSHIVHGWFISRRRRKVVGSS